MHAMNKGEIKLLRQREDERGESWEKKVEVNFHSYLCDSEHFKLNCSELLFLCLTLNASLKHGKQNKSNQSLYTQASTSFRLQVFITNQCQ